MLEKCKLSVINVATNEAPKVPVYSIFENGKFIYVWDAILIRILSQVFRVPYKILLPPDGEWGKKLPDGNWTGLIGMVERSEVDLAVGGILITEERLQAVSYSYPNLFSVATFMTDKPKPVTSNLALFHPFFVMMWSLIISVVSFLLFFAIFKKERMQRIMFEVFGSFFGQPIHLKVEKLSIKLLLSAWLFFVFVLINCYKAVYSSFLSFPSVTGIRTIEDLAIAADQNKVTCYTLKGHGMITTLLKSKIDSWITIGQCLLRNINGFGYPEEYFTKASHSKAYLMGKIHLMEHEEDYFISEDSFFYVMFALPISSNFRCQKELNRAIHRLSAAGLFEKHIKDAHFQLILHKRSFDASEPHTPKKLQFADLKGAFLVLVFGYILASITFIIELATYYYFLK